MFGSKSKKHNRFAKGDGKMKPYKIIVWGPGYLGSAVIRELLKRPEFELVGVLAYSKEKNGKDVGELLGMDPIGVMVTTDQEKIFNMEADCVIHAGTNMMDDTPRNKEVVRLLESGKNVVAAPAYHFPPLRGTEYVEMLESACRKGGVSLHGTGINPGLFCERIAVTLTGVCNEIDYIHCREITDSIHIESERMLRTCGFGLSYDKAMSIIDKYEAGGAHYYHAAVAHTCHILGYEVDRIGFEAQFITAKEDLTLEASGMTIRKGEVVSLTQTWTGYVKEKPFFILDEIFYIGREYCPVEVTSGDHYTIHIEGKPTSIRCRFDLMASVEQNITYREGDHTMPAYYATVMPLIQAVPVVCAAEPGIVYPKTFAHYSTDYRNLTSK